MIYRITFLLVFAATVYSAERIEFPPPADAHERTLDIAALQAWYGTALDLKSDPQLAKDVQRAEALIANLLHTADAAKQQPLKQQLLALKISPSVLRAVVRHGQVPAWASAPKGEFSASIPVPGFKGRSVELTLLVPQDYTDQKSWPVMLSFHGAHGNGAGYLKALVAGIRFRSNQELHCDRTDRRGRIRLGSGGVRPRAGFYGAGFRGVILPYRSAAPVH